MSRKPDLVTDLIDRLRRAGIEIPETLATSVEMRFRFDHGGELVRIAKRPPDLAGRITRDLSAGATTTEVQRRYGVSRSTVFRARGRA